MLNYVWIFLLLVGVFTAVGNDIHDEFQNPYRNGIPLTMQFETVSQVTSLHHTINGNLRSTAASLNQFYGITSTLSDVNEPAVVSVLSSGKMKLELPITENAPAIWKDMAQAAGNKEKLEADVISFNNQTGEITCTFERITFVKLRAITRAAIDYVDTAVTISLGLIGVMALWLGIMKVGEAAGMLHVLTRALTPITKRLFPDVPPHHPAVASMIMNVAASMLGLNNAATPLGLKAMDELNKLNPKIGTATNAMCTFLVLNTSGLTLIPATAIAIRAGLGSSDPGIIIGTSIFGAACATIVGLISVKMLQRLPWYKIPDHPEIPESKTNG